jgi:NTP pyrophosphatase (non-canonical NTP hydrolase)
MEKRLEELKGKILEFREKRNWKQFHNPKNLALSITIEAAELMELFQWLNMEESLEFSEKNKEEIESEIADIFNYLILLCNDLDIDLVGITEKKLKVSEKKYPVKKARDKSTKYNKL